MNPLHLLRRAVRTGSWALGIGTVAAIVFSALIIALASVWPDLDPLRAALVAVLQASCILALTWLAGLVIELSDAAGLLTGLWAQALPALVVLLVEGPLGLEPQLGFRLLGLALGAAAGLVAVRFSRRRHPAAPGDQPPERTASGPPSEPTA